MLIKNTPVYKYGKNAVSAGHDATMDTAFEILASGGNAFDAAIAAFFTSFVAEPCMSSAGAGAFANTFRPGHDPVLYDFFSQTPRKKNELNKLDFKPIEVDFGDSKETFHVGKGSSAIPGAIAGMYEIHKDLGSMPMKELVQPAIRYAKEGIVLNDFQHLDLTLLQDIFRLSQDGMQLFFKDDKVLNIGEKVYMHGLADFLDYMSIEGKDAFYKGEIPSKIVNDYKYEGHITLQDFENYKVIKRPTLNSNYKAHTIATNGLPSMGGALMTLAVKQLQNLESKGNKNVDALYKSLNTVNAIKRHPLLLQNILDDSNSLGSHFDLDIANKKWGSTSHLNIVDKQGNAVSMTFTIGEGSGYFIEGTDMQMNNMLGESALLPDGFHSWIPDTRLSSMMSPTLVFDQNKELLMALGSGGASRIPSMVLQVINNYLSNFDVEKAIEDPRFHTEHGTLHMEPGVLLNTSIINEPINKWTGKSLFFGGVHAIAVKESKLQAYGDQRRDGVGLIR